MAAVTLRHPEGIGEHVLAGADADIMNKRISVTNGHTTKAQHNAGENWGWLYNVFHYTLTPLFMYTFIPNLCMLLWFTTTKCSGSIVTLLQLFSRDGVWSVTWSMWTGAWANLTWLVVLTLLAFSVVQFVLMKVLPGRVISGPLTPHGYLPQYKDNGLMCYVVTMILFGVLTLGMNLYGRTPTYVYDKFDGFLLAANIKGHIICSILFIKGHLSPTTPESGSSGNILFDYYWGMDLYPKVFGVDVKVFTNCRFGMTAWPILCLIFALKSYEVNGFVDSVWVSTVLQMLYITKFFIWESGYYQSIDIIMDRAGYMICWGCVCYVPAVYASVSLTLATHPIHLGPIISSLIFIAGASCIALNYWADYQRQIVRSTQGNCTLWGSKPEIITAKYHLKNGEERSSILLMSGFWGLARHFNYVPEILLALFWTVPALFTSVLVYYYTIYLAILLVHRAFRDDDKCRQKYGHYWEEYCKKVPSKIIPGIF